MLTFATGIRLAISILVAGTIAAACSSPPKVLPTTEDGASDEIKVTVFQSPDCGCCEIYKGYLMEQGFQVETQYTQDMYSIKKKYQIPQNMGSCHTVVIGDYFVEGHVPIEAIAELLEEKPDIDGIALPGMPSGSPGMPGRKTEDFIIYALSNGVPSEFMLIH